MTLLKFHALLLAGLLVCATVQADDAMEAARRAFRGDAGGWPGAVLEFRRRAEGGDAASAYYLGLMVRNGMGTRRDSVQAARWMGIAASGQVPAAMFLMSNMLREGEGVAQDLPAARALLEAAAERDYPEAIQQLALAVQEGAIGYERDERRAAQLLKELGHAMRHRPPEP